MITFYAVAGQSLPDVCMNTYGSMDYFFKLLQDNNITNPDALPSSNYPFLWDNTLVVDAQSQRKIELGNIKYSTANVGGVFQYLVLDGQPNPLFPPEIPPNPATMYQKTSAYTYTATEDEISVILIPALTGKDILQIERNIQPLTPAEYVWDKNAGTITLTNPMITDEKLFILYTEMVTP